LDFVKKTKVLEKDLKTLLKGVTYKSHSIPQLKAVCETLEEPQLSNLSKHGDYKTIVANADQKIEALKDLLKKLESLDVTELADWEAKQAQAIKELNNESAKADKLREVAREFKQHKAEEKRSERNAEFYQRKKISDKLTNQMECGKEMAAAVAHMWREIDANGMPAGVVVTDEMTIDFRSPIVWTDASERGKKVLTVVKAYQEASKDKIGEKVQGLTTHLEENEKKDGVMVVCVGNDQPGATPLPGLKAALELPDDELYFQEEGASP